MWVLWLAAAILVFIHPLLGMLALLILTIWTVGVAVVRSAEGRAVQSNGARIRNDSFAKPLSGGQAQDLATLYGRYLASVQAVNDLSAKARATFDQRNAIGESYGPQAKAYLSAHGTQAGIASILSAYQATESAQEAARANAKRRRERARFKACPSFAAKRRCDRHECRDCEASEAEERAAVDASYATVEIARGIRSEQILAFAKTHPSDDAAAFCVVAEKYIRASQAYDETQASCAPAVAAMENAYAIYEAACRAAGVDPEEEKETNNERSWREQEEERERRYQAEVKAKASQLTPEQRVEKEARDKEWSVRVKAIARDDARARSAMWALKDTNLGAVEAIEAWDLRAEELGILWGWLSTRPGHGDAVQVRDELVAAVKSRDVRLLDMAKASVPSAAELKKQEDAERESRRSRHEEELAAWRADMLRD